jgi:hypothetical protein
MDALKLAGVKTSRIHPGGLMTRRIVKFGDPVLRAKGKRIDTVDEASAPSRRICWRQCTLQMASDSLRSR